MPDGAGLFELPPELAIDTDVARRVILEFIRGPAQAGRLRAGGGRACRAGSIRPSSPTSSPRRSAPERLLCLMLPYRTSAAASRADAETVIEQLGCAGELVDISPMVDAYFGRPDAGVVGAAGAEGLTASALRRGNMMARIRMTRPLRPLGDVGRAWSSARATRPSR